jgi:UDP-glucose 4-epimerase
MMIVVTGSAGFIGEHVVQALRDRGETVVTIDKKHGGDLATNIAHWRDFGRGSIDGIIHLAGTCSTPGSVSRPDETFRDTVVSAASVLDMARTAQVPIVITSSVKARDGMTPYGAAKRMVELWAQEYRSAFGMKVIINRPGTVYGPGQEGSLESGWIAWFLEAKRMGEPVIVNGDGNQVRDLLHVSDYVELLVKQITHPAKYDTGQIYDVGGGWDNAVSVNQIVDYLGLKHSFGPPRYGDARTYVALNDAPDWAPKMGWRKGLAGLVPVTA